MAEFIPKWTATKKPNPQKKIVFRQTNTEASPKEQERDNMPDHDSKAKAAGFMIGVPGELYTLSLSKSSAVYIEQIGNGWQAWRETYQKGHEQAMSTKTIAKANTLDYVLMKAKGYFEYIERKRGAKVGK